jgi:drug/metabolite transporter (DMT)-like permease
MDPTAIQSHKRFLTTGIGSRLASPSVLARQSMTARPQTRNIAGMAALALGIFVFSTQDAIIKSISGDYALTQAIVIRSVVSLPILAAMVHAESGLRNLISANFWGLLARGLILLLSYTAYYMAFPALPLAEAIALFFVSPIFVTLLAGPLLGERVSLKSWLAVAIGFAGVLFIVQPGGALFEPAALLGLVSAAANALAMIFARKLGVSEPATVMAFNQNGRPSTENPWPSASPRGAPESRARGGRAWSGQAPRRRRR